MGEKRRFKRKPITIDVNYDMSADQPGFNSAARDISVGGICLITRTPLPTGHVMDINFSIPDMDVRIRVSGKVVWSDRIASGKDERCYNGIEFVHIEESDRDLIGKFVDGATFQRP